MLTISFYDSYIVLGGGGGGGVDTVGISLGTYQQMSIEFETTTERRNDIVTGQVTQSVAGP